MAEDVIESAQVEPAAGLLDNTPIIAGRYIAHIAIPCRELEETARWYAQVLGAQPVRILKDRVTSASAACYSWSVTSSAGDRAQSTGLSATSRAHFLRMEDSRA